MGVDIYGVVECRLLGVDPAHEGESWLSVIDLDLLYAERDYDAFGCLFGVQNYAHFRPVAAERGLPEEVSGAVRGQIARRDAFGVTWVTWTELKAIDWNEPAEYPDSRIHIYERREHGELVYEQKSAWNREFAKVVGHTIAEGVEGDRWWPESQEWEIGGKVYRSERLRRRDAVSESSHWQFVFKVMEALALRFGDDGVRLVVWFDA
jgi:hypothetical protein